MKRFISVFTNPFGVITRLNETGDLRLSFIIIFITAAYNGLIAPVVYYYRYRGDFDITPPFTSAPVIFAAALIMYLIDCGVLLFSARIFGQRVSFRAVAATWGVSFVPTLICSLIVNNYDYYFFIGRPVLQFFTGTVFLLLLIWKAIFYFMECNVVLRLKGIRLAAATAVTGVIFAALLYADALIGLKVPML